MANVEYLICSFCQGPSSRPFRERLQQHIDDPDCRIRHCDLDWLDKWRLLLPSHVEWDVSRLADRDFQREYEDDLPKKNIVSKVDWAASIEGRISDDPEWVDLDGWRTVEFTDLAEEDDDLNKLFPEGMVSRNVVSKRTLHPYNDDIQATRLPFHSACLAVLYEACNAVTYNRLATSTVSDVVAEILLPSWEEGDVNMDHLSRRLSQLQKPRLIVPWSPHWHPLDLTTNVFSTNVALM
jgi:hypothetical protein